MSKHGDYTALNPIQAETDEQTKFKDNCFRCLNAICAIAMKVPDKVVKYGTILLISAIFIGVGLFMTGAAKAHNSHMETYTYECGFFRSTTCTGRKCVPEDYCTANEFGIIFIIIGSISIFGMLITILRSVENL